MPRRESHPLEAPDLSWRPVPTLDVVKERAAGGAAVDEAVPHEELRLERGEERFCDRIPSVVENLPSRTRTVIAVSEGFSRYAPMKWPLFLLLFVNSAYSWKCFFASSAGICSIMVSAQIRHRYFILPL